MIKVSVTRQQVNSEGHWIAILAVCVWNQKVCDLRAMAECNYSSSVWNQTEHVFSPLLDLNSCSFRLKQRIFDL